MAVRYCRLATELSRDSMFMVLLSQNQALCLPPVIDRAMTAI